MAPAGFEHGAIINRFAFLLTSHVEKRKLGIVVGAETGFTLARKPDTVRGADVAFIQSSRLPKGSLPKKFWDGAPDLAAEVVSPGDTLEEVEEKVDDYLTAGARMVLVINPKRQTISIHRPKIDVKILRREDTFDGGDVVPGFRCQVSDVFV